MHYVDFDYTLFGSSSTDAFLRTARPFVFFWLVFGLLRRVFPWGLFGHRARLIWKDAVCCQFARVLNPGILGRFRKRAPAVMAAQINPELVDRLKDVPVEQIVIVSFGMRPVIRALLAETRFAECSLVAPTFSEVREFRRLGKRKALEAAGFTIAPDDLVLTDNFEDDSDLVEAVTAPILITPPSALDRFDMPYLPFFYTARIKRTPGFFVKQIILEELPIVILAFGLTQWWPDLRLWACLSLLFAALIIIYELGYAENDRVGETQEVNPKLSQNYHHHKGYSMLPGAWIYALGATLLAILCLDPAAREAALISEHISGVDGPILQVLTLTAIWMAVLVTLRLAFWIFNTVPIWFRVYWYVALHSLKYLSFGLFFSFTPLGQVLIFAHIVRTWALYAVRRSGGDMEVILSQFVRLVFLLFAFGLIALEMPLMLLNWQAGVILAFCVARALPEFLRKAKRLSAT